MERLLEALSSAPDLLLVILGFSAIIIIHEGGHFFAARWAGIRVLAFAVGFGPAMVSYRKGLGFRKGSSEHQYNTLLKAAKEGKGTVDVHSISPTEYRLNCLPFGGYVKMLGQDDADPTAKSDEPDSYQNCVPWKRMVVISAGVVFNIITAAILFIIVFNPAVGLRQEVARIGRSIDPDKPAYYAVATNAVELGVTEKGLRPGDTVVSINGERPSHFNDISLAVAMAHKNEPIRIDIQRANVNGILHFELTPKVDPTTKMLSIGVSAMVSDRLSVYRSKRDREKFTKTLDENGFPGLASGMRLVEINGVAAQSPYTLDDMVEHGIGAPVTATFVDPDHPEKRSTIQIKPEPRLAYADITIGEGDEKRDTRFVHLMGLTPVLAVDSVIAGDEADKIGLRHGDIFARIGSVEWPSVAAGVAEFRAHRDTLLEIDVLRQDSAGHWNRVPLGKARTSTKGQLGFNYTDSSRLNSLVTQWPVSMTKGAAPTPSGGTLPGLVPGSRIVALNGQPVTTLSAMRDQLRAAATAAPGTPVTLEVELLTAASGAAPAATSIPWQLTPDELASLGRLGWDNPLDSTVFEPETFIWKSDSILGTIPMGLHETHRVMMNTYLTFARLFQGSVKPEHLKGPVGIAHLGVSVAEKGPVWLLFFLALISVNLAVINFLPMPIADGGHMVFLIYEQFTGRPPSVRFQNAAAIVGLVFIGTLLLFVTFKDVSEVVSHIQRFFKS